MDSKELTEAIEAIYRVYPRKVGKPRALKAIKKALKKNSVKKLLRLVEQYASHIAAIHEERKYIPHPASWFNAEAWNDFEDWEALSKSADFLSETEAWFEVRDVAKKLSVYMKPEERNKVMDCVAEPARGIARRIGWSVVLDCKSDFLKLYRKAVK